MIKFPHIEEQNASYEGNYSVPDREVESYQLQLVRITKHQDGRSYHRLKKSDEHWKLNGCG